MSKNTIQPGVSFDVEIKDTKFTSQTERFYDYLLTNICTASMVSDATGISQKNICRYKRQFEKAGLLWQVEKKFCQKTKHPAWYITTNPEHKPFSNQLTLF
jgi:hypothetical protein